MTNLAVNNHFPTFIPQRQAQFSSASVNARPPVGAEANLANLLQSLLSAIQSMSSNWGGMIGQAPQMTGQAPAAPQNPWSEFQQSVQGAVKENTMPGFENSVRQGAAADFVHTKMSGEQLYEILQRIPDPEAQASFYGQAVGTGRGMNNLAEVVLQKKFNGDQAAYSRWTNLHNSGGWAGKPGESEQYGPGSLGNWNLVTGEWSGGIDGQKKFKIPGWGGV